MSVFGASRGLGGGATIHTRVAVFESFAAVAKAIEAALTSATTIVVLVAACTKLLTVGRCGVGTGPNVIAAGFSVVVADGNRTEAAGANGSRIRQFIATRAIRRRRGRGRG